MVIRDVARVLDVPYAQADTLAKMIPNELHITIKKALEQNKEMKALYDTDQETKKVLDIAMGLEGMPRQASTHACGIVITKEPVDTYVPLFVRDEQISTQYIMTTLEELGLLKMDFLGLRTLTVIQDTINLVKQNYGKDVEFDKEMNDPKVYKLWQEGRSCGIFQFESQGMTNFMKELKPDCLEDIIAGVSLYRPGPMDQIPRYVRGKLNPGHNEYTHPSLEPILNVTYGCMVYQEQVMQIVRDLAGYSLGRADLVRRAMGKKKLDVMAKEREVFIHGQTDEKGNIIVPGCVRNGIDEKSADKIFDEMAEFAKYAFNKSHAACYAVIAYRTAYLKAYYPAEFMASMLNSFLGNLDKIPQYINECKAYGIEILKPDINKSFTKFTTEQEEDLGTGLKSSFEKTRNPLPQAELQKEDLGTGQKSSCRNAKIRFGLGSIKNVGTVPVENIVKERNKNGAYESFTDFCERIADEQVNKKCIESLIKAGAFDSFEQTRATLLASFETIVDTIQSGKKKGLEGQVTMFDLGTTEEKAELNEVKYSFNEQPEFSERELLSTEKDMLGIYITGHPLSKIAEQIKSKTTINTIQLKQIDEQMSSNMDEENMLVNEGLNQKDRPNFKDGQQVKYAGIITNIKKKYTKNNKIMAFVSIEDLYGVAEFIVFENAYMKAGNSLTEENIVLVEGRLSIREDEATTIIANDIKDFDAGNEEVKRQILTLNISSATEEQKDKLRGAIKYFNGDRNNMRVQIKVGEELKPCGALHFNEDVFKIFEDILGKENVRLKE